MSLKAFHILFITVSTLFALGFGAWCFFQYRETGHDDLLVVAIASVVGAILLVVYGRWFLRKLKGESNV
ncbi:MAG: hypothetical protein ACE5E5_09870 [Phycisphaerae bacterium]